MTTILAEDNKLVRQKLRGKNAENDESRSFLKISRENLSISHSDIEQGFNRSRFRFNKNTALSVLALLLAVASFAVEIWKLHRVAENVRDIEILKRDVETLKHRFLEEDLLDELKAFEEQLYGADSNDDEDVGDSDMEVDYDLNYEDDVNDGHVLMGDYQTSDYEESTQSSSAGSDKDLKETLAALHEAAAKKGQEFEKNVRENRKNIERERLLKEERDHHRRKLEHKDKKDDDSHVTQKRSVLDDVQPVAVIHDGHFLSSSPQSHNRSRMLRYNNDNQKHFMEHRNRSSPKKYHTQNVQEPHDYLSSLLDVMKNEKKASLRTKDIPTTQKNERRKLLSRDDLANAAVNRKLLQKSELAMRLQRREMTTPRHLRVPRQVYAVHYEADSSLFSSEDEHTGNGRAKHNAGIFKAWRPSDWVTEFGTNRYFSLSSEGRLTVHEPGLYLVYAQIHYLDEHDENGFHVLVNGRPILQCMIYSPGFGHKSRSCFSSQVTVLRSGDHMILKDVGSARYTLFQRDKSFFGLVKLGDLRQQSQQQQRHQTQQTTSS